MVDNPNFLKICVCDGFLIAFPWILKNKWKVSTFIHTEGIFHMLCHRTRELRLLRTDQEFEKVLIPEKIESKIYVHH